MNLSTVKSISYYHVHSEQAVIAHTSHGHTVQLSTGLSAHDSRLVVSGNPVKGK